MRNILKFFLVLNGVLACLQAQAQRHLLVANGGIFASNPPVFASLQSTDLSTGITSTLAQMRVTAVQDIKADSNRVYVAATDSIFIFDIDTAATGVSLFKKIHYPGVRKLQPKGNQLYVGKFYGTGAFLSCYQISNGQLLWEDTTIKGKVNDILLFGYNKTVYFTWNLPKKSVTWEDSVGFLYKVESPGSSNYTSQVLNFYPYGGYDKLLQQSNALLCSIIDSQYVVTIGFGGGVIPVNHDKTDIQFVYGLKGNSVFGKTKAGNLELSPLFRLGGQGFNSLLVSRPNIVNAINHPKTKRFYVLRTNYSSDNALEEFDSTGTFLRSFNVGNSPEFLTFFRAPLEPLSISEKLSQLPIHIFPNPVGSVLNLSMPKELSDINYSLYTSSGTQLEIGKVAETISVDQLSKGIYWLRLFNSDGESKTLSFIKE